jgi:hypothetical protein
VSPVFNWDDEVPTVVEVLTYWTTSSMGLPGAWDIPMVGNELADTTSELPCTVHDLMPQNPTAARALFLL